MSDRIRLDGKVAVVTGAAGVIGTATMRLLAERGARVVAVDRKERELQTAIKDLPASAQAFAVTADVSNEDDVADYVRTAVAKFGTIDVFYNNAGIEGEIAPITRYPLEAFRRVLDVNVVGVFLGLKHVLPVMLKQNKGSIINTASIAGLIGSPDIAVYSASKHAVIGLTKSAALECSATAVRVNCVCPGLIDSRMLSAIIEGRNPGNAPVPNERIVEAWRVVDWPAGIYSIARFEFRPDKAGTTIVFDHTGFPKGLAAHLSSGWSEHYWAALSKYFEQ